MTTVGLHAASRADGRPPASRRRAGSALLAAAGGIALVAVMAAGLGGPVRAALGLIVIGLVPGWAVVGFLPLRSLEVSLALSLATSLALVMAVAEILLWVKAWHPTVAVEAVVASAVVACVVQAGLAWRRPPLTRHRVA